MTCPCGNPAQHQCAWKLRRPFAIRGSEVREGDKIQLGLAYVLILSITGDLGSGLRRVDVGRFKACGDVAYEYLESGHPVMVMRNGRCEAPVCESCAREVSEGIHYCRAHWSAHERQGEFDQSLTVEEEAA